jgi:hypothetical protein
MMTGKRFGWTAFIIGAVFLVAAIVWGAAVWSDDDARMRAAGGIAGLAIVGILGVVWGGIALLSVYGGGSGSHGSDW